MGFNRKRIIIAIEMATFHPGTHGLLELGSNIPTCTYTVSLGL
jgi:hypothetical protein